MDPGVRPVTVAVVRGFVHSVDKLVAARGHWTRTMSQLPTKATHRQTRAFNVRLVLRCLYDLGPISRAEIARRTHLTRTTVSDVVAGLLDEQLVEEVGRGPSSG